MTTFAQIKQAVITLTQDDFQKLYQWMIARDHQHVLPQDIQEQADDR